MDISTLYPKMPEHSLLRSLGPEDLAHLLVDAREHKAKKGEVLLQQGDKGDFLIILLDGQARVTVYSANGREIVLEYATPGTVLGEIALIDGGVRSASVITMGPVRYLTLSRPVFERVIAANHGIALRLMREMAMRLRLANETIETDRAYGAAPRLARFLMRLLKNAETNVISLSQTELAMFAGISRENINRQLALWAQVGIVELEHGKIRVLEVDPLEEIADAME
ncbi:Crp/Fnr family transcriptional regulator [Sphingobium sp. SCG-1]|uniref:Crp/Fnr family transcriptional regulator n=1 Tax=Sphingobium sp. SCG-1 TaxID=2072936 RepID=UPI000CD67D04|nr:Crp/Fnr family transcriptional regulator [Sphingobium sp. SCG-1]AUW58531.1 Crp/Fnr family transcriptional regulator [Sphingobium sp. SCG-1]